MKNVVIWLAVGAALVVGGPIIWMQLDNLCTLTNSLGEGESVNQCYTRWIGALSGWAAAIVGIGAIVAAYNTIQTMRNQSLLAFGQHKDKELADAENRFTEQIRSLREAEKVIKRAEEHIRTIGPNTASADDIIKNARGFRASMSPNIDYLNGDPDMPFRARLHVNFVRVSINTVVDGMERQFASGTSIPINNWLNCANILATTRKMLQAEHRFASEALDASVKNRRELNERLAKIAGVGKGE